MGMFNNLFNNKNNATPVNDDPIFTFVTNYLTSGADDLPDPNSKECLAISDIVFSAVTRISNDVADIPITTGTQYQSVLLNKSVGNGVSTRQWIQSSMENMLLFGDSFSLIQRDNNGMVQSITLLPTPDVTVLQNSNGLEYQYNPTDTTYSDADILKFSMDSLNGKLGVSPLLVLRNKLRLSRASNKLLRRYYEAGAINKLLLVAHDKLNKHQRLKLKDELKESLGARNAFGAIATDNTVDIKPLNFSNVDGNIIKETQNMDNGLRQAVASVYGIPSEILNYVNSHNNGQNVYSEYRLSLNRYIHIIVSELNNKLNGDYSMNNPLQPLSVNDLSNACKNGAMDKQQAQEFMGLDQTPDKPTDNKNK